MSLNEEDKKTVSTTARAGALGKQETLVEGYLRETFPPNKSRRILDFGCGAYANSVGRLRRLGYRIVGYDFRPTTPAALEAYEGNLASGLIIPEKQLPRRRFEILTASNVLNIQPTISAFYKTINSIKAIAGKNTRIIANFPRDPRSYFEANRMGDLVFREHMRKLFQSVDEVRFRSGRIWVMTIGEKKWPE